MNSFLKNPPQPNSLHSNQSLVFLLDELIVEVLSFLPVNSLMRFKCVCKSWKTLISHPTFVKLHLKRSTRNKHITLNSWNDFTIIPFPVRGLLDNTSITLPNNPYFQLKDKGVKEPLFVVGSLNGLLCLLNYSRTNTFGEVLLYVWNPATRTLSNTIVFFHYWAIQFLNHHYRSHERYCFRIPQLSTPQSSKCLLRSWKFAFGYCNSTDTYKIVAFHLKNNEVRVFDLHENSWRDIQSFPATVVPLDHGRTFYHHLFMNCGVCVSGTINWLSIRYEFPFGCDYGSEWPFITIDQFVIILLDLTSETYRQLLPPRGFDNVPPVSPTLVVLMDSLCFCHDFHGTHFIIWQMKEFEVEESWTQFLKISYQSLPIDYDAVRGFVLFPLCLSEDGDTLILVWDEAEQAILYNLRANIGEKAKTTKEIQWFVAKEYVESLASTN